MKSLPEIIKDNSKGDFEDSIRWTEFRGTKKEHSLEGKITEKLPDGCYRVERTEVIYRTTHHIVHFEKVDEIRR